MSKLSICVTILFFGLFVQAQSLEKNLSPLTMEDAMILPLQDNEKLWQNEMDKRQAKRPNHFAVPIEVSYNLQNSGVWETSIDDNEVWRLYLYSKNAYSLNLGFTQYQLPEEASLFIYNIDKTDIKGPFTKSDNDDHLQLWTPIIRGETIVIELQLNGASAEEVKLELTYINHDFADIFKSISGSCNVDVSCGAADGYPQIEQWRDEIRSVAAFHINGVATCSGALINNTNNDQTPYFLTAQHCGINMSNDASVVAYFNYENSTCRQPNSSASGQNGDGQLNQFMSGSTLRSRYGTTDMCLIEFDDPIDPDFQAYFSGWNREKIFHPSAVCIHHPGVEEKRISFENNQLTPDVSFGDTTHVFVNDWDLGTTEGGSSGSPLFDPEGRIIGQLTGGLAACGNDESDFYGWLARSWLGGGTDANSLKPWLDPDDTGATSVSGINAGINLIVNQSTFEFCTETTNSFNVQVNASDGFFADVNLSIDAIPNGLQASISEEVISPGGTTSITFENLTSLNDGTYEIIILGDDGTNFVNQTINITISTSTPGTTSLISPENGIMNVPLITELIWSENTSFNYHVQLSQEEDFSNILFEGTSEEPKITVSDLDQNSLYYWRIRGENSCGMSEFSEIFSFSTALRYCQTFTSNDLPIDISESGNQSINSNIIIEDELVVEDINIQRLNIDHTYINDLTVLLLNPENETFVNLLVEICDDEDNILMGFDDDSQLDNIPCPPTNGDVYKPDTPLRVLNGINAQGPWTLNVQDNATLDGGQFNEWSMEICFSTTVGTAVFPFEKDFEVCQGSQLSLPVFYNTLNQNGTITLTDDQGSNILDDNIQVNGNEEIVLTTSSLNYPPGNYEFFLNLSTPSEEASRLITLTILETPSIEIINPENGGILNGWQLLDIQGSTNDLNLIVASDENFNNIVWEGNFSDLDELDQLELSDGQYFLEAWLSSNCGDISELVSFEYVAPTTSVDEVEDSWIIYPNPASDQLIIINDSGKSQSLEIIDPAGRLVFKKQLQEHRNDLQITSLHQGVYFIQIQLEDQTLVQKLVVH